MNILLFERSKQVKVQQISLKERLERLSKGYPSDPAFVTSAIRSLADIPICIYLREYPEELEILAKRIVGVTKDEMTSLTYKDVASKVYEISRLPRRTKATQTAIKILSLPLRNYHSEKKFVYGGKSNVAN